MRKITITAVVASIWIFMGCAVTTPGRIVVRDKSIVEVYDKIVMLFTAPKNNKEKAILIGTEKSSGLINIMVKYPTPIIVQLTITQTDDGATSIEAESMFTAPMMGDVLGGTRFAIREVFRKISSVFPNARFTIKNKSWDPM